MKKILSLLALMMLTMTSAWAGTATFDLSKSPGTSTPSGFFTHEAASAAGKWSWNNKFKDAEYDGISFSQGLKMEGATAIDFTTTAVSKVTIVQSTWSANTIKFDGEELSVSGATAGTGCRIYTIENVAAGDHVIARGSGESGLFYVKVEWTDSYTATFENTGNWAEVYAYAWVGEVRPLGDWPGTQLTADASGKFPVTITGTKPEKIIFNNNAGVQTDDLDFKDGGVYNASGRVITLTTYSATFKTDGMTSVWAYVWNGDEKALGDWPGTQMTPDNDNTWKIDITTEDAPKFIIFHDNAGNQTPDLAFEDGKAYEYMLKDYAVTFKTDAGWGSVNAYAWSGEGDNAKEFFGTWPGEAMIPANEINNGFGISFKAFNAPEKIIFNNGEGEQTADLPFINEKAYKWITATPYYALKKGDTFAAGTTVDLGDATITYGVDGGADFGEATAAVNEDYAGFAYMTGGNGENGSADGGTVYTIVPKYDGTITVGVRLNGGKKMHINEDGTDLADYAGITIKDAANTTFDFAVKAGSTYKIWCDGSKLGFFGFDYKFTKPEPVGNTYTVYFENTGNWAKVFAYAWYAASGDETGLAQILGTWPGTEMKADAETGIFAISFDSSVEPTGIIFNNGVEGEGAIQTEDLVFENGKTYSFVAPVEPIIPDGTYYVMNANEGTLINAESKLDTKGTPITFTFDATANAYTIEGIEFFQGKQWTIADAVEGMSGYYTISTTEGFLAASGANALEQIADGTADAAVWILLQKTYWEDIVNSTYTVAGTKNLTGTENDWDIVEANQMVLNDQTGLFEKKFKKIAIDSENQPEFKVVQTNMEGVNTWYPENNWVITPDYVGGEGLYDITITFDPSDFKEIGVIPEARIVFPENAIVYDFEAAAEAGENPANKNGSAGNGQAFYGWENAEKTDSKRQDYKGYEWAEGSVLPEECHVWRRSDRINGNVADNGGLKCPSNKEMAIDGLNPGDKVIIVYDAENATDKEIVWAIGDGTSGNEGVVRATATINGVEAVTGETTIASGAEILVNSVTPAENGTGYIVFQVKKGMVIQQIAILPAEEPATEYFLVGNFNVDEEGKWITGDANYKLAKNEEATGEEYTITLDLPAQTVLKVWASTDTWFPASVEDDNRDFNINDAGNYTIYFRPNADGDNGWFYGVIYCAHNGPATGISSIVAEKLNNATIYNLNGQRVQNAQKGLYIINGRKVVVK